MQPSTSEETLSKVDDTARKSGGLELSKENDVTVVAMVDLENNADSDYEGKVEFWKLCSAKIEVFRNTELALSKYI